MEDQHALARGHHRPAAAAGVNIPILLTWRHHTQHHTTNYLYTSILPKSLKNISLQQQKESRETAGSETLRPKARRRASSRTSTKVKRRESAVARDQDPTLFLILETYKNMLDSQSFPVKLTSSFFNPGRAVRSAPRRRFITVYTDRFIPLYRRRKGAFSSSRQGQRRPAAAHPAAPAFNNPPLPPITEAGEELGGDLRFRASRATRGPHVQRVATKETQNEHIITGER